MQQGIFSATCIFRTRTSSIIYKNYTETIEGMCQPGQ